MDKELNAVIVVELKKGEKTWEEEEQAEQIKGFTYQLITLNVNTGTKEDYGTC